MNSTSTERPSLVATGVGVLASSLLILGGVIGVLQGIVAFGSDTILVRVHNYLFAFDADAWGWIHVIVGALATLLGFAILFGATWARAIGIGLTIISAIVNFLWLPYYPIWGVLAIAIDILVIWALANYSVSD